MKFFTITTTTATLLGVLCQGVSAQAQTTSPTTPSPSKLAKPAPRVTFEAGVAYWQSSNRFQKDLGPSNALVSRLTCDSIASRTIELYARLDRGRIFLKGNTGIGFISSGQMHDEDWNLSDGVIPYSNTLSQIHSGEISSATIDLGLTVLNRKGKKAGVYVGYNYFRQKTDKYDCLQLVNPEGGPCNQRVAGWESRLTGIQYTVWNSLRVGVAGESKLGKRWKLNGEFAYLPLVGMVGRDNHLLRPATTWFDEYGNYGRGLQIEATATYLINDRFSFSAGWRYWSMKADGGYNCTSNYYDGCYEGSTGEVPTGYSDGKFSARRSGFLLRVTGRF